MKVFHRVGLAFKQLVGAPAPACLWVGFSRLEAELTLSRLTPRRAL